MAKPQEPSVKLPGPDQIGIVVKDVDKTTEYFSSILDWGPFQVQETELHGFTYLDQPCDCRLKVASVQSGLIEIELIEVVEGDTPHSDFLREKGEGLQHLRFLVEDYPGTMAKLTGKGIEQIWYRSEPVFAYVSTDTIGGVMFELVEIGVLKEWKAEQQVSQLPGSVDQETTTKGRIVLPPVSQVGIVVRDIERTATHYASTFGIEFPSIIEADYEDVILRGKPVSGKMKYAFARSGSLQIELIEPIRGGNIYTEFLASRGEGLHHLGYRVEDMEQMLAAFAEVGVQPVFHKSAPELGYAFAYLDTDKIGGVMCELLWNVGG